MYQKMEILLAVRKCKEDTEHRLTDVLLIVATTQRLLICNELSQELYSYNTHGIVLHWPKMWIPPPTRPQTYSPPPHS